MRWLTLYARSRRVPATLVTAVLGTLAVWSLAPGGEMPVDARLSALALTLGVTAASVGLAGQDHALDRTAAIRWVPRRAAHVLLIGMTVALTLLAVWGWGQGPAPTSFVVRDSAGLTGLLALGAVLCGARHAWTLPTGWLAFALFLPPARGVVGEVARWPLLPPEVATAHWTALALAATGTAAYALTGPRPR